ncbi:hypothetical protein C7453_10463 [Gluconacetobacter liquefaciens]|uniref:Uncharacterized protein n=1 Tax=Gluconacetobacter liquefaciens TaxID=89584 RepID=A0A370G508_GLULI|nr:hypothetical protein C7453_10463 [Gluconacetobacter liquefaciens]
MTPGKRRASGKIRARCRAGRWAARLGRTHVRPGTVRMCWRSVFPRCLNERQVRCRRSFLRCEERESLPSPSLGQHKARQACVVSRTRLPRRPAVSVRAVNRDHPAFYDIVSDDLAVSMDGNFVPAHTDFSSDEFSILGGQIGTPTYSKSSAAISGGTDTRPLGAISEKAIHCLAVLDHHPQSWHPNSRDRSRSACGPSLRGSGGRPFQCTVAKRFPFPG